MHSRHLNSPGCKTKNLANIPNGKLLVLFDGFCPFCQASVKLLKRLDWFNRLECKSFRDAANVPELQPPLSYAAMEAEMHAVSCCGEKVRAGFAAFLFGGAPMLRQEGSQKGIRARSQGREGRFDRQSDRRAKAGMREFAEPFSSLRLAATAMGVKKCFA